MKRNHSSYSLRQLLGSSFIVPSALALMLQACGGAPGESTLKGRTSDDVGSQKQALSSDSLGGSGTVSAVSKIRVNSINQDGTLSLVAEANVTAGGSYELKVPSGDERLIAQAVDSSGNVRASGIIESTGKAGDTVVVSPLTTETSVEANVLAEMVAEGVQLSEANAIDLRARIDADTAAAVKASADEDAKVKALADGIIAAQRAQLHAYAQAGVQTTQASLFEAELAAATRLNASLDAAADAKAGSDAYETFLSDLSAKWQSEAKSSDNAAKGERAASVAFRATVRARLQVSGQAADPVADAAARAQTRLEAKVSTDAMNAALTAGGAAQAVVTQATQAATTLHAALSASTSAQAAAQAYAAYRASVAGSGNVSGSVLGNYLEVSATTQASADAAVNASVQAAAQLDTALNAAFAATLSASSKIDADALATQIVQAYAAYDTQVQGQGTALAAFGSKASVAVDVLVIADGSVRAAE